MSHVSSSQSQSAPPDRRTAFAEGPAWSSVGKGWRPLFGSYRELGFSFEWHEFTPMSDLDWARSFHPGSVELCLNLEGSAWLKDQRRQVELRAPCRAFYFQGAPSLIARRRAGERHRFITVEFSPSFIEQYFKDRSDDLHPLVQSVARGKAALSEVAEPERMETSLGQLVESLRHCPVFNPARELWFRCKALELASHIFFRPAEGELFCTRTQRAARERVERARTILRERLSEPPTLEELGRIVGCSPYYLSRLFSQEAGMTIQQYLRQVRMERAAELLRTGKCNVTEAAFEVGYNSLSHFSATFHETFGCCPGLYPVKTTTQKPVTDDTA